MANVFQPDLGTPESQGKVFAQPASTPVDNTVANAINATSNLIQIGTDAYKTHQNNQVIKSVYAEATKNMSAVQQGRLKAADADIKDSAFMSSLLVSRPDLAPEIKNAYVTVRGTSPTEEVYKQLNHERELEQTQADTTKNTMLQAAANAGFVYVKEDGTPDVARMQVQGSKLLQQKYALDLLKLKNDSLPTAAERSAALRRDIEPEVNSFMQGKVDVLVNQIDSMKVDPVTKKYTPEQEKQLFQGATNGIEKSVVQLRQMVIDAGGSAEDADYQEGRFRKTSEKYLATFTGDYSSAKLAGANLSYYQDTAGLDMAKKLSGITAASAAGINLTAIDPDDLVETNTEFTNNIGVTTNRTGFDPYVGIPTKAAVANNAISAVAYGKPFANFQPEEQNAVFNVANKTMNSLLKEFNTTTPQQRQSIANSINIISEAASAPSDDAATLAFANRFNKPDIKAALPSLSKDSATSNKVTEAADKRISYIDGMVKKAFQKSPDLSYNAETNKVEGNPLLNSLIGNVDTFYPYSSLAQDQDLNAYKAKLFELPEEE